MRTYAQNVGTLSGSVVDTAGSPISGININIFSAKCEEGKKAGDAITDADGNYSFSGIPVGEVYVSTYSGQMNYLDESWDETEGTNNCTEALPINIVKNENASNIDFSLEMGGSVSGKVTDAIGKPAEGLSVIVYLEACSSKYKVAQTDNGGGYAIYSIPLGNVYVRTFSNYIDESWNGAEGATDCAVGAEVRIFRGKNVPNIDFLLDSGGSISGKVTDVGGTVIEGISVSVLSRCDGGLLGIGETDAQGLYTVNGILPGDVYALTLPGSKDFIGGFWNSEDGSCKESKVIQVAKDSDTQNINFALKKGATVSGRVTDINGGAISDVPVSVYFGICGEGEIGSDFTDIDGNYTISGLPAGGVFVSANTQDMVYRHEVWDAEEGTTDCTKSVIILVESGKTKTGIDFALDIPPVANPGGPYKANVNKTITFDGSASFDLDGDTLTYDWDFGDGSPRGSGVKPTHAYSHSSADDFVVTLVVNDGIVNSESQTTTSAINVPPFLAHILDQEIIEGETLTLQLFAVDADRDVVTFSASSVPSIFTESSFASVKSTADREGVIEFKPDFNVITNEDNAWVKKYVVTVRIDDGKGGKNSQKFTLTVSDNRFNELFFIENIGNTSIHMSGVLKIPIYSADLTGKPISLNMEISPELAKPGNAVLVDDKNGTGYISFTAPPDKLGSYVISVTADNGSKKAVTEFKVEVTETVPTLGELGIFLMIAAFIGCSMRLFSMNYGSLPQNL